MQLHPQSDAAALEPRTDLSGKGLRVCFPILLEGDLVTTPEHLGVAYLVAVLRNAGADCCVMEVLPTDDPELVAARMLDYAPHIVGLTLTTVTTQGVGVLGNALRRRLGDPVLIVAGGPLATFHGAKLFDHNGWGFLDVAVRGEAEITLLRLAEAVADGRAFDDIPGLIFKSREGALRNTGLGHTISDLDSLPFPARDQQELHGWRLPYVRISTSRGCTSQCTFCNAPHAGNNFRGVKLWRAASVDRVLDEIEYLYRRHSQVTFDFVDSTFEDPGGTTRAKQRLFSMADGLIKRDLRIYFNCCVQALNWHEEDRDLIDLLCRAGLEKVLIGVESGSNRELTMWRKRSTVEDNLRAINLFRAAGAYVAFGFIMFHPYSDFDSVRENISFLRSNVGHNLRRFTTRLELYPGTAVLETLRADGLVHEEYGRTSNPYAYSFRNPAIARLAETLNRLYGERYAATGQIDEEAAVFTFETFDITLHTFFSRLRRHLGSNAAALERLERGAVEADRLKATLAQFNNQLLAGYVDAAERGRLFDMDVAGDAARVEAIYRERISALKAVQLRTGIALQRMGDGISGVALRMRA